MIQGQTNVRSSSFGTGNIDGLGKEISGFVFPTTEVPWQPTQSRLRAQPTAVLLVVKTCLAFVTSLVLILTFCLSGSLAKAGEKGPGGLDWSPGMDSVVVAIPAEAGETLHFAARELARYLRQMTQDRLEITTATVKGTGAFLRVVSQKRKAEMLAPDVGVTVGAAADPDAYVLRVADGVLSIDGAGDRAVLFGVYDLLERLDCRWFGPGVEFVPVSGSIHLDPLDIHEKPSFKWRGLELITGTTPAIVDWMAKVRLNVAWPESYVPNQDLTPSTERMGAGAVPQMRERGMSIFWGGHILPYLMPVAKYQDHPEYFALIKGKRLNPDEDLQNQNQLCVSNPETLRVLTGNTIQFLQTHPWIDVLFIWAGDTTQWCECDKCLALLPEPNKTSSFGGLDRSALYTMMVKAVGEGVHKALPARRIAFNHYYNLENLPTDKDGKVMENVLPPNFVLSAVDDYHQCDRHSFADTTCPRGKRIEPVARMWTPYYAESVSWSYYFAWNFMLGLPISEIHKIPEDFRFLRGLGLHGMVDNVSLEPGTLHWFNNFRNFFIYGKAAWNPDLDVDATMQDFDRHFYGPAAQPMIQTWRVIDEATRKYGQSPRFMPEHVDYAKPRAVHGRMRDIESLPGNASGVNLEHQFEYLIPNRKIYDQLATLTRDALARAEAAPSPGASYVGRVLALKAVVEAWDKAARRWEPFGFLNGGGYLKNLIYALDGKIDCSVFSGNNMGDCFWSQPTGTQQLVNVGDSAQVKVSVNAGPEIVGAALYRGGPGLYQSADQTTAAGTAENHSAVLSISNRDHNPDGRQVSLSVNDGKYESSFKSSPDHAWQYREPVGLRIDYVATDASRHVYRYYYDAGNGWVDLGIATFAVKLPYVAPSFHFSVYEPKKAKYPIAHWTTAEAMVLKQEKVDAFPPASPTTAPAPSAPLVAPAVNTAGGSMFKPSGFFNGGGEGTKLTYREQAGEVICTVNGGNNIGDSFWPDTSNGNKLDQVGDFAQVEVKVNADTAITGEAIYRSGPGLYLAGDRETPCGAPGGQSVMLMISNDQDDTTGARRVIAIASDRKYQTASQTSGDHAWDYGKPIALRIEYLSDIEGLHAYRCLFDKAGAWQEVATFRFKQKLAFVAPMHKWGGIKDGALAHYPIKDWAAFSHFKAGHAQSARPQ